MCLICDCFAYTKQGILLKHESDQFLQGNLPEIHIGYCVWLVSVLVMLFLQQLVRGCNEPALNAQMLEKMYLLNLVCSQQGNSKELISLIVSV